jgi:predicted RNA-binding protein with RPS1 domain
VKALKSKIPDLSKPPEEGATVTGRVVSIKKYGAFLKLPGGETGLLHNSELAHEWVEDANTHMNVGDEVEVKVIKVEDRDGEDSLRISLSRKAIVPKPENFDEAKARPPRDTKRNNNRKSGKRKGGKSGKSGKRKGGNRPARGHKEDTGFTMGELLLAKLEEQKKKKDK